MDALAALAVDVFLLAVGLLLRAEHRLQPRERDAGVREAAIGLILAARRAVGPALLSSPDS